MMRQLLYGIILISLFVRCQSNKTDNTNEGVITYKIIYPKEVQEKGYATFLPTKMISTFKDNNYKVAIKGELSLYQLEYISRANGDSTVTLFRIFDKRLFHEHDEGEHLFLFESVDENRTEFIANQSKEIAGINCQKAIVHFSDPDLKSIEVYYTEEIAFNRPKENSPFDNIPGALMEFKINFKNLELNFLAEKIDIKEINPKSFIVPANYEHSEHGEIDELVSSLLQ